MSAELDLAEPNLPDAGFTQAPPADMGFAAGFGQAVTAAYKAERFDGDAFGRQNALSDSVDARNVLIQKRTGATLDNPLEGGYDAEARARLAPDERLYGDAVVNVNTQARRPFLNDRLAVWQEKLGDLAAQYPDQAELIGANKPVLDDAKRLAIYWRERAGRGEPGLNAVAGLAASFIGGAGGFFRNPLNIGMALATGGGEPAAASLFGKMATMGAREAVVNAGMQAVAEPGVQGWRAERGIDAGFEEAAKDVSMAGAFGAAFGAGVPAAKAGWWRIFGTGPAAEAAGRAAEAGATADREIAAAPPPTPASHIEPTLAQAVDHGEGVTETLPEMPAPFEPLPKEAAAQVAPGAGDMFEQARLMRDDPRVVAGALASDAPDLRALGQLASLGDGAFEEARAGRASLDVALATAARVRDDDAEQLAVMRDAMTSDPKTPDDAAAAVSRAMEARAAPDAVSRLHGLPAAEPVQPPKFARETEGALDKQIAALESGLAEPETVVTVKPKRNVTRKNPSLFEALASEGGLAPNGELAAIFDGNPFVPGFGRLIRKGGRNLDDALTAAKDMGYMHDPADFDPLQPAQLDVNDLLDLLRKEAHGERVYRLDHDPAEAKGDAFLADHRAAQKELKADPDIGAFAKKSVNAELTSRAATIMLDDGVGPREAWSLALSEHEYELLRQIDQFEEVQQARIDAFGEIDGWDNANPGHLEDLPPEYFDARNASLQRADAAGESGGGASAGGENAGAGGPGGGNGGASGGATAAAVEPGAEGKPQLLIPGVSPVTDRQRAELLASKPLRGGDTRPPAGGLFDEGARAQTDLLDLTPTQDGRALPQAEALAEPTPEETLHKIISKCPL